MQHETHVAYTRVGMFPTSDIWLPTGCEAALRAREFDR